MIDLRHHYGRGDDGLVAYGRTVTVAWPAGAQLEAGSYELSVNAHDHTGGTLLRAAHSSGEAGLKVTAPPLAPPSRRPDTGSRGHEPSRVCRRPRRRWRTGRCSRSPARTTSAARKTVFGAPRDGYTHQGQDMLTAEGTPVVAPLAGTILIDELSGGRRRLLRGRADGRCGFDFMFAHCKAASLAVSAGQAVTPGRRCARPGRPATRPLRTCTSRCGSGAGRPRAANRSIRCRTWKPGNTRRYERQARHAAAPPSAGGGKAGESLASTGRRSASGEIAQLVEHTTENRGVGGSSPPLAIALPLLRDINGFM